MNIDTIRSYVKGYLGKEMKFRYNAGRGQIDEFTGIITDIYNGVFIIKTNDYKVKSFSYSDVLINNLIFLD